MIKNEISDAISDKYSYGEITNLRMQTDYIDERMSFSILPTYIADYEFKEKNTAQ